MKQIKTKKSEKQQPKPPKVKNRPEWDSNLKSDEEYKLSKIELVQKKVSLLSKNREIAKEQWRAVQEKLQNGIIDDDTIKSKNLGKNNGVVRKNLSQMMDFYKDNESENGSKANINMLKTERTQDYDSVQSQECFSQRNQDQNGDFLTEIQNKLQQTREFINNVENCACSNNPTHEKENQHQKANQKKISQPSNSKERMNFSKSKHNTKKNQKSQSQISFQESMNQDLEPQNDPEIEGYFKSLNKIEDSIKFMENKIINAPSRAKSQSKESPKIENKYQNKQEIIENSPKHALNNLVTEESAVPENDNLSFTLTQRTDFSPKIPSKQQAQKNDTQRQTVETLQYSQNSNTGFGIEFDENIRKNMEMFQGGLMNMIQNMQSQMTNQNLNNISQQSFENFLNSDQFKNQSNLFKNPNIQTDYNINQQIQTSLNNNNQQNHPQSHSYLYSSEKNQNHGFPQKSEQQMQQVNQNNYYNNQQHYPINQTQQSNFIYNQNQQQQQPTNNQHFLQNHHQNFQNQNNIANNFSQYSQHNTTDLFQSNQKDQYTFEQDQDMDLSHVKEMLESTKKDIEQMSQIEFDIPKINFDDDEKQQNFCLTNPISQVKIGNGNVFEDNIFRNFSIQNADTMGNFQKKNNNKQLDDFQFDDQEEDMPRNFQIQAQQKYNVE